jgi:hypothetical protein
MRHRIALAVIVVITVGALAGPAGATKRADRVTARSLVVRAGDLTGDWTASPPDDEDPTTSKAMAKCVGVKKDPDSLQDAEVEGLDLTRDDGFDVASSGIVFKSRAALKESLSLFDRPKLSTCFERLLRQSVREDEPKATIDAFNLEEIPVTIPGVRSRAFRLTVTVSNKGDTATIYSDELLAWKGRLGSSATVSAIDSPLPNELESEVATVLGQRLLAAG